MLIIVTAHRTLNPVRGVLSEDYVMDLRDEELVNGWKEENVVSVQRIKIRRDDKLPTKHI